MFGYVVADKGALRIREYDYYRATYCGLCHAMGKCTGYLSRMTLSYDMTFFALVRESIEGVEIEYKKKRCPRHPFRKIQTVDFNSCLEYSACVGGILTSGKIKDNISDEKGVKRALASFLSFFFSKMDKKSNESLPEAAEYVLKKLNELSDIESNKTASVDAPAEVFGELMAYLLSHGLEGEKKLIAKSIGKRLGRWIYIVDALDDYEADRKSGSYNPFVLLYGAKDFSEDDLESISKMLEAELALAFSAFELLDVDADKERSEVIKNVLCLGMPAGVKRVCGKKKENKNN